MRRVRLSVEAGAYVRAEANYLRQRSAPAAARFNRMVAALKRNLSSFPALGHLGFETPLPGVRRIVMDEYLVDYVDRGDVIRIIAIRHGQQMPPNQQIDPDDDFEVT